MELSAGTLYAGRATGPLLLLEAPLSFWGGVDAARGLVSNPRHPQHGRSIAGTVLAIERLIGSSSSSAVLLELIRVGRAPAALVLGGVDAILVVGCLAGRELGYACPPVVALDGEGFAGLPPDGVRVAVDASAAERRGPANASATLRFR